MDLEEILSENLDELLCKYPVIAIKKLLKTPQVHLRLAPFPI